MALICFLSTECAASIYVLDHVLVFNYHMLLPFYLMYGFSGIEVSTTIISEEVGHALRLSAT